MSYGEDKKGRKSSDQLKVETDTVAWCGDHTPDPATCRTKKTLKVITRGVIH